MKRSRVLPEGETSRIIRTPAVRQSEASKTRLTRLTPVDGFGQTRLTRFVHRPRDPTTVTGAPSGVIAAHPRKDAGRDQLMPCGACAPLNEVDGNLCLWLENASGSCRGRAS